MNFRPSVGGQGRGDAGGLEQVGKMKERRREDDGTEEKMKEEVRSKRGEKKIKGRSSV